jgi:SAM-dependent methyltransferase
LPPPVTNGGTAQIKPCSQEGNEVLREENTTEYWNHKWALREQRLKENVTLDGSDGEVEFDRELQKQVRGKDVLDVGCGPGEFTLRIAERTKSIVGVDTSRTALVLAERNLAQSSAKNATFRYGDIKRLPFPGGTFDLIYSRRGPAGDSKHNLGEVLKVLKSGGAFMEICIGERDKRNLAEIFGRGQMLGFKGEVSAVKKRWLEQVGFKHAVSRDYVGTEIFRTLDDLVIRLRTAPIIPSFDVKKDREPLKAVQERCTTERGIETPVHRVVLMGQK